MAGCMAVQQGRLQKQGPGTFILQTKVSVIKKEIGVKESQLLYRQPALFTTQELNYFCNQKKSQSVIWHTDAGKVENKSHVRLAIYGFLEDFIGKPQTSLIFLLTMHSVFQTCLPYKKIIHLDLSCAGGINRQLSQGFSDHLLGSLSSFSQSK